MNITSMEWMGGMLFHSKTPSGHDVFVDASPEVGGKDTAPRPMEMMLISLMGCTGMDVISILKKMRAEPKSFRIEVEYQRRAYHPRIYERIRLIYIFSYDGEAPRDKIEKAVQLSQRKYCSASEILRKSTEEFDYEIVIE